MMDTAEPSGESDSGLNLVQLEILRTIRRITRSRGRPPSMREVARALDRTSAGGLSHQYSILEAKRYLRRDVGCPRTVRCDCLASQDSRQKLASPGRRRWTSARRK